MPNHDGEDMWQRLPCPIFFCSISPSNLMAAVHRVVGAALLYTNDGKEKNKGTKVEVED